mgnify:CR=1 FL=1
MLNIGNFVRRMFGGKGFVKILTESAVTVKIPGRKPFTMARENKHFKDLLIALDLKDEGKVLEIVALAEQVTLATKGAVEVKHGQVFYKGEVVGNIIAKRIIQFMAEGINVDYLINFLERVMLNPSKASRDELYLFLENGNLPIMDDGRFQAYKWVRDDYMDQHSNKFRNYPGDILSMKRTDVDSNRNTTCSTGFHVCTQFYDKFAKKLMLVAVDPADVVSVPIDYNNAKMRVCKYEVLEEIENQDYGKIEEKALTQYGEAKERGKAQRGRIYRDKNLAELGALNQTAEDGYSEPDEDTTTKVDVPEGTKTYNVRVTGNPSGNFIPTVKVIRKIFKLGLKDATDLVRSQRTIGKGLDYELADKLRKALQEEGVPCKLEAVRDRTKKAEPKKVSAPVKKAKPKKKAPVKAKGVTVKNAKAKVVKPVLHPRDWDFFKHDVKNKASTERLLKKYPDLKKASKEKLDELKKKAREELKGKKK